MLLRASEIDRALAVYISGLLRCTVFLHLCIAGAVGPFIGVRICVINFLYLDSVSADGTDPVMRSHIRH